MKRKSISKYKRTVVAPSKRVDVKREAKQVNKMIRSLTNNFKSPKKVSYALENLVDKLADIGIRDKKRLINQRTNLVQIKNLTSLKPASLRAVIRVLSDFRKSESSTKTGISSIGKRQRQTLLRITGNEEWVNSLSDKDIENFNRMFDDRNYELATQGLDSMSAYGIMLDSASGNLTEDQFVQYLEMYSGEASDVERRKAIGKIYKKYIMMRNVS